ncbi:E3 ubiquitin-protein ligase listerin-like protein [Elsinoe fawcettii]|nr:E3 ubiquitin-protein ligase listerin-like protein [Elsinoe fawcettii]
MKKTFKSQASSGRAGFGAGTAGGFGTSAFASQSSPLSHVYEPPNFSTISDPNVVVQLKNLMKKDGKTKSRALEDLISHVTASKTDIEEGLFTAYIKLYPRLSIDAERRVRQLSHVLIGHIVAKCGKRVAPQLPQLAGPWLCGQHDPDRATSRSASEAFQNTFSTQEKAQNFLRLFHRQIVEYCRDAVLHETPQTLSDIRNVSKENADAIYYRVVATSLSLVATLIMHMSKEELDKASDAYTAILTDKIFLELLSAYDPPARNAVIRIFRSCTEGSKYTDELDYSLTAHVVFNKVLPSDQTATAGDVLGLLVLLTEQQPSIWSTESGSKKSPDRRLRSFIKRGAQSSVSEYWNLLTNLFDCLPPEVLPSDLTTAKEWMTALLEGATQRQEPRHITSAWSSYSEIAQHLWQRLPANDRTTFAQDWLVPVVDQYVQPNETTSKWTIATSKPESIVAKTVMQDALTDIILPKWAEYTANLIDSVKLSQPEQSNDFDKSQRAVITASQRWLALQLAVLSGQHGVTDTFTAVVQQQLDKLRQAAIDLLGSRRGKPYAAASILVELVKQHERLLPVNSQDAFKGFLDKEAPELLSSPSRDYLFAMLHSFVNSEHYTPLWNAWASRLSQQSGSNDGSEALVRFLLTTCGHQNGSLAVDHDGIQRFLQVYLAPPRLASMSTSELKPLLDIASDATISQVLSGSVAGLTTSDNPGSVLDSMEVLDQAKPGLLRGFATSDTGSKLLPQLISMQQTAPEDIERKAASLHERLIGADGRPLSPRSATEMVRRELHSTSQGSLPVSVVSEIIASQLQESADEVVDLLTSLGEVWEAALQPFLSQQPAASLSLMDPLAGTLHLVDSQSTIQQPANDNEGLTQALRIAMFALSVLSSLKTDKLEARQEAHLLSLLSWTAVLANDNSNVFGSNKVWTRSASHPAENIVADFVADAQKLVTKRLTGAGLDSELLAEYSDINMESVAKTSTLEFCKVRAYTYVSHELYEGQGLPKQRVAELEEDIKAYRKDEKTLPLCAAVTILAPQLKHSTSLQRYFNELVADVSAGDSSAKELQNLVILNLVLKAEQDLEGIVQKHRLVLLTKHLIGRLGTQGKVSTELRSEVATAIRYLSPQIRDMYGEHWGQVLNTASSILRGGFFKTRLDEGRLVLVHATLRLYAAIQKLSLDAEPNEDIFDALKEYQTDLESGIVALLIEDHGSRRSNNVPLDMTEELVARHARKLQTLSDTDAENLWPQLDSSSSSFRTAAFEMLGRYIDIRQEGVSFDAALDKKIARLPEQLLSLILDAPDLDTVLSASFDAGMPSDVKTYLLSWLLVYRHFDKASANVREHYVEDIRSSDYLPPLLDLIYDFLGLTTSRPVDASKFAITTHDFDDHDDAEKETQSALVHLYYLTLTHLPSLAKQHYLSQSNRTLSNNIATWTAKHISPHVISFLFSRVNEWSTSFASDPSYENFSLKVSPKSREVTASYLIDEQPMSILIALPEAYPLTGASVNGLSRAALDPKKWQSWIRGCQGVIQFSNGDLVDGLRSWRMNVKGALAGQSECSICYSIISGDKQLPTKKLPSGTYDEIYPSNPSPKVKEVADKLIELFNLFIDMGYIKAEDVDFAPHKHLRISTEELAQLGWAKDVVDLWQMMPYFTNRHGGRGSVEWNFGSDAGEFLHWGEFMDDLRGENVDWWRQAIDPFYALEDLSPHHDHDDRHEQGKSKDWNDEGGPYMRPWYATLTNCGNKGSIMIYNTKTDHIWLLNQLGGTTDRAFQGMSTLGPRPANLNDLNQYPSRPACIFMDELITNFRSLHYIPGGLYPPGHYQSASRTSPITFSDPLSPISPSDPDFGTSSRPTCGEEMSCTHDQHWSNFRALYIECGWPHAFNPLLFHRLRKAGGKRYSYWSSRPAPSASDQAAEEKKKDLYALYMEIAAAASRKQDEIHVADARWKLRYGRCQEWERKGLMAKVKRVAGRCTDDVEEGRRFAQEKLSRKTELEFWREERGRVRGREGRYAGPAWSGVKGEEWEGFARERGGEAEGKIRELEALIGDGSLREREVRKWNAAKDRARGVVEEGWKALREWEESWASRAQRGRKSWLGSGWMDEDVANVLEADLELEDVEREVVDQLERRNDRMIAGKKWRNEGGRVAMAAPPEDEAST